MVCWNAQWLSAKTKAITAQNTILVMYKKICNMVALRFNTLVIYRVARSVREVVFSIFSVAVPMNIHKSGRQNWGNPLYFGRGKQSGDSDW